MTTRSKAPRIADRGCQLLDPAGGRTGAAQRPPAGPSLDLIKGHLTEKGGGLHREAASPPVPAKGGLVGTRIPYHGSYRLRGRWLLPDYTGLRNAAWAARNNRVSGDQNPLALRLVLSEAERLIAAGEPLGDVLEAFAELLMRS